MRRPLTHLALMVCLTVGALLATSPAAYAHTDLVSSSPASGATVASAPREITLTFSKPVAGAFADLVLVTDDGTAQPLPVGNDAAESTAVRAAVPAELRKPLDAPSTWRVDYRVTSADGHPIQGSVSFEVSATPAPTLAPATTSPQAPTPTPDPPAVPRARPATSGTSSALLPVVGAGGLGVLAVVLFGARRLRRRRSEDGS